MKSFRFAQFYVASSLAASLLMGCKMPAELGGEKPVIESQDVSIARVKAEAAKMHRGWKVTDEGDGYYCVIIGDIVMGNVWPDIVSCKRNLKEAADGAINVQDNTHVLGQGKP